MNRLSHETSPYLLQHADNPVDWRPWGEEAFLAARESGRPVFLSIGYSSCHWCHVMEQESFRDPGAAALLNSTFVCVKVDREERPDVDGVYMRYGMAMTGSGGWPLTVLLTPEGKPFFVATYIPLTSSHGRLGLMELIPLVAREWADRRDGIEEIASRLSSAVALAPEPSRGNGIDDKVREACFRELASSYDSVHGGFGQAPKFPSPHGLIFLLRHWRRTGEPGALEMAAGLQAELDNHFSASGGGYCFSGDYADPSLPRFMEGHDGALPSGNSVTLSNLLTLWGLTGEPSCLESARGIAKALSGIARSTPSALTMLLAAPSEETAVHAAVYGRRGDPEVEEMLRILGRGYRPGLTVLVVDPEAPGSDSVPGELRTGVGTTICRGGTCLPPARSPRELELLLDTLV